MHEKYKIPIPGTKTVFAKATLLEDFLFDCWWISSLNVPKKYRGQGWGEDLLRMILADADDEGVELRLYVWPHNDPTIPKTDLIRWYRRNGFKWIWKETYRRKPKWRIGNV